MIKLLFVCSANICRSPAAEVIMNTYLKKAGLSSKVSCDSAGIHSHEGQPADERMGRIAATRGYEISHISRPVTEFDLIEYDYILAMDQSNYADLRELGHDDEQRKKIHPICRFCAQHNVSDVPNPYTGSSDQGFNVVLDILEDACQGLLKKLKQEGEPSP